MTREEIIEQGCPEQPFDFDTDQEEMWYNIVLIHLSDANANAVQFQEEIQRQTLKTVNVASPGMIINFNKSPF